MGKWVNTSVENNTLIINVKKGSKYDTTYYTTTKQEDFCNKLMQEKNVNYYGSNSMWNKYLKKYNMSELIDVLIQLQENNYDEIKIEFC